MKRVSLAITSAFLALSALAGPASARDFGAVYVDDLRFRVFGNAANVSDGTGADPFATFRNSTNAAQLGVAQFAPGSPPGTMAAAGPCTAPPGRRPATPPSW